VRTPDTYGPTERGNLAVLKPAPLPDRGDVGGISVTKARAPWLRDLAKQDWTASWLSLWTRFLETVSRAFKTDISTYRVANRLGMRQRGLLGMGTRATARYRR